CNPPPHEEFLRSQSPPDRIPVAAPARATRIRRVLSLQPQPSRSPAQAPAMCTASRTDSASLLLCPPQLAAKAAPCVREAFGYLGASSLHSRPRFHQSVAQDPAPASSA